MNSQNFVEFSRIFSNALISATCGELGEARVQLGYAKSELVKAAAFTDGEEREMFEDWLAEMDDNISKLKKKIRKQSSQRTVNGNNINDSMYAELFGSHGSFEAERIPDTCFDDIAGLDNVKEEVNYKTIYPRKYPEIYQQFNKKYGGGILLYGLPGTGKTMIAEAIAHETNAKFYPVRCSDLGSKWFGETEKNIGQLFSEAREQDNAVIFFDEIEAYTNKRRDNAMNRVVPELLSQMQGVGASADRDKILIIAATNRPWDMDSAFLRPGRFDERIYVPLPDIKARQAIIANRLKGVPCQDDINIDLIALRTEGFNGADVDYLCEKAKEIAIGEVISGKRFSHELAMCDFETAFSKIKSSVQDEDIQRIKNWM